jgi:hypothetical protein
MQGREKAGWLGKGSALSVSGIRLRDSWKDDGREFNMTQTSAVRCRRKGKGGDHSMAQDMTTADALTRHVFGPGDPSVSLLDIGRFPPGWVEEYRLLLGAAAEEWAAAPVWPRHMVGALHFALTHLRVRYSAWQGFGGGGRRDEDTERELCRVEAPTLLFFARAFPRQEPRNTE